MALKKGIGGRNSAKTPWKIQRLIKGVFYPRLPYRLTSRKAAREWGERFGARWGEEYDSLIGRYGELFGKTGRIPTLTGKYIRRKMELGSALSNVGKGDWKEKTRDAFGRIVQMRREDMYPVAMLPFTVLKYEKRARRLEKDAERLLRSAYSGMEFYDRAIARIKEDEKKVGDYGKKLALFRAQVADRAKELEKAGKLTGREALSVRNTAADLDMMAKHVDEAQIYLRSAGLGIRQKMETAKFALGRIQHSGHYGILHYGPKHEKPYYTGKGD